MSNMLAAFVEVRSALRAGHAVKARDGHDRELVLEPGATPEAVRRFVNWLGAARSHAAVVDALVRAA